jgi:FlaG/FlaF family flagellin (archaellin)
MNYRKFRKNMTAISPIISVLLMIAIAVVASLVVYAWVMGYIGYQTGKTGDAVQIQSVNMAGDSLSTVYLQNTGSTTVTVNPFVFVNGQEYAATLNPATPLAEGSTSTITLSTPPTLTSGQMYTIKVTVTGGTYGQITQQAP